MRAEYARTIACGSVWRLISRMVSTMSSSRSCQSAGAVRPAG
mgnify:CR=1 FL=1